MGGGLHCFVLESCCCLQSCSVVMEADLLAHDWTGCWIGGSASQLGIEGADGRCIQGLKTLHA